MEHRIVTLVMSLCLAAATPASGQVPCSDLSVFLPGVQCVIGTAPLCNVSPGDCVNTNPLLTEGSNCSGAQCGKVDSCLTGSHVLCSASRNVSGSDMTSVVAPVLPVLTMFSTYNDGNIKGRDVLSFLQTWNGGNAQTTTIRPYPNAQWWNASQGQASPPPPSGATEIDDALQIVETVAGGFGPEGAVAAGVVNIGQMIFDSSNAPSATPAPVPLLPTEISAMIQESSAQSEIVQDLTAANTATSYLNGISDDAQVPISVLSSFCGGDCSKGLNSSGYIMTVFNTQASLAQDYPIGCSVGQCPTFDIAAAGSWAQAANTFLMMSRAAMTIGVFPQVCVQSVCSTADLPPKTSMEQQIQTNYAKVAPIITNAVSAIPGFIAHAQDVQNRARLGIATRLNQISEAVATAPGDASVCVTGTTVFNNVQAGPIGYKVTDSGVNADTKQTNLVPSYTSYGASDGGTNNVTCGVHLTAPPPPVFTVNIPNVVAMQSMISGDTYSQTNGLSPQDVLPAVLADARAWLVYTAANYTNAWNWSSVFGTPPGGNQAYFDTLISQLQAALKQFCGYIPDAQPLPSACSGGIS